MGPRRAEESTVKRVAAFGCRLPVRLPAGEILTDVAQKEWRLGQPIGCGGFGDIYLASDNVHEIVNDDADYVIKIEPHNNGPLFVEMNFYIRAARQHAIDNWCKSQRIERVGVPTYEGSGSHVYRGERYRFLVIPRYGTDVEKLFISYGKKLPTKIVNSLAVQMLDALEYIHSCGYAHADVKGSNIMLELGDEATVTENLRAYLVDYGLAYRFRTRAGTHKPFVHDERRAHEGTLEFTSRDAHDGTHSRRGDMETLGYNLLQWLCGTLPWQRQINGTINSSNPEQIHAEKEKLLADIPLLMRTCFPRRKKPPAAITTYMKYVAALDFEAKPNYCYLRSLFRHGTIITSTVTSSHSINGKRVSDENISSVKPYKMRNIRERWPCKPVNGEGRITRNTPASMEKRDFSWQEILAQHPDKLAKISSQSPLSPLTPPPSPPPPSLPTYAMLNVMRLMRNRQSGVYRQKTKQADSDSKPKWMTPAMEEVAALRCKSMESSVSAISRPISDSSLSPRLTRSRVANLKRVGSDNERQTTPILLSSGKPTSKKRKAPSHRERCV